MQTIEHSYPNRSFFRFFTVLFDLLGLFFPLIIFITLLYDPVTRHEAISISNLITMSVFALILWPIAGPMCVVVGNYFTDIVSDSHGLHMQFLWRKLDVPWADIIAIKSPGFPVRNQRWVVKVRAKSLTPIHRLYSFYPFPFSACLVYDKNLSENEELTKRINSAIKKNQRNGKH